MEQPLAIVVMNPQTLRGGGQGGHTNFWSCLINLALSLKHWVHI